MRGALVRYCVLPGITHTQVFGLNFQGKHLLLSLFNSTYLFIYIYILVLFFLYCKGMLAFIIERVMVQEIL